MRMNQKRLYYSLLFFFISLLGNIGCQSYVMNEEMHTSPVYRVIDNDVYYHEIRLTYDTWNSTVELYLNRANQNNCSIANLRYGYLNQNEFESMSDVCYTPPLGQSCDDYAQTRTNPYDCVNGCAYAFYERRDQTIYISNRTRDEYGTNLGSVLILRALMRHEALHWLSDCTNRENAFDDYGNQSYSNSDAMHRDRIVWSGINSVLYQSGHVPNWFMMY